MICFRHGAIWKVLFPLCSGTKPRSRPWVLLDCLARQPLVGCYRGSFGSEKCSWRGGSCTFQTFQLCLLPHGGAAQTGLWEASSKTYRLAGSARTTCYSLSEQNQQTLLEGTVWLRLRGSHEKRAPLMLWVQMRFLLWPRFGDLRTITSKTTQDASAAAVKRRWTPLYRNWTWSEVKCVCVMEKRLIKLFTVYHNQFSFLVIWGQHTDIHLTTSDQFVCHQQQHVVYLIRSIPKVKNIWWKYNTF